MRKAGLLKQAVEAALSYKRVSRRRYPRATVKKRHHSLTRPSAVIFQTSLVAVLVGFGFYFDHAASFLSPPPDNVAALTAELASQRASPEARNIALWAVDTQDHAGLPFVVVDKSQARLYAFDPQGRLKGSTPVLLGTERSDDGAAPATPAGRFVTDSIRSAQIDGIVWINDRTAVTLHGLPSAQSPGRGEQRLASPDVADKRISDGSLHVAGDFYRDQLSALRHQAGIAYVLPELLPVQHVFRSDGFEQWWGETFAQLPRMSPRRPS